MPDTITVYTLEELREQFPDAFEAVYNRWVKGIAEISWSSETMDSLRAVIDRCGATLTNWQIGADASGNSLSVLFDYNRENWTADDFRREVLKPLGYTKGNGHAHFPGLCKLTGYCADDCMLESVYRALKDKRTLVEALEGLADVAGRMMEEDLRQCQGTDEMLVNWGSESGSRFTEDGTEV